MPPTEGDTLLLVEAHTLLLPIAVALPLCTVGELIGEALAPDVAELPMLAEAKVEVDADGWAVEEGEGGVDGVPPPPLRVGAAGVGDMPALPVAPPDPLGAPLPVAEALEQELALRGAETVPGCEGDADALPAPVSVGVPVPGEVGDALPLP